MTPIAVFDCMIFPRAAGRTGGPAYACLERAFEGRVILTISHDIVAEVRDVLTGAKVRRTFPAIAAVGAEMFVNRVLVVSKMIEPVPPIVTFPRDPKDEPYLDLADALQADYLVSWDRDLLDLPRSGSQVAKILVERNPRLQTIDPVAFLREVENREEG